MSSDRPSETPRWRFTLWLWSLLALPWIFAMLPLVLLRLDPSAQRDPKEFARFAGDPPPGTRIHSFESGGLGGSHETVAGISISAVDREPLWSFATTFAKQDKSVFRELRGSHGRPDLHRDKPYRCNVCVLLAAHPAPTAFVWERVHGTFRDGYGDFALVIPEQGLAFVGSWAD